MKNIDKAQPYSFKKLNALIAEANDEMESLIVTAFFEGYNEGKKMQSNLGKVKTPHKCPHATSYDEYDDGNAELYYMIQEEYLKKDTKKY